MVINFSRTLTLYFWLFYRIILIIKAEDILASESNIVDYKVDSLPLEFVPGSGYVVKVEVGGQPLKLLLDPNVCGIILFENTDKICSKDDKGSCYDPYKSKTASWCVNTAVCVPGKFNYQCKETPSPSKIKELTVDSDIIKIYSIEGLESLKIAVDHKKSPYILDKVPVKLGRSLDRYDRKIFTNVDGIFGISGTNVRFPSKLFLGTDRVSEDEIVWSEKRQTGGIFTNSLIQFTIYDLKMCNTKIFGRTSSNWEAAIDLTTPYLILPKNFWMTMMSYLPVDKSCFDEGLSPRLCKLTVGNRLFPIIEFKLSESYYLNFEKVETPSITIPLENLIYDDGDSKTLLIIPDEFSDRPSYTLNPTIKFGYKVLESLNVVVDSDGYRVGLISKNQLVGSFSKCSEVPQCFGDQVYEPALNICLNPICSIWLMKRLNPEKGICETSFVAKVVITTVICALVVAELYCNFARKHILRITSRLCR
uniref:Erythrocyte membrane-associated malaria antigen-like n=1 Tax=Theileria annulata TaxID=5874 RepID=A0A3B0N788_THEAN